MRKDITKVVSDGKINPMFTQKKEVHNRELLFFDVVIWRALPSA